MNNLVINSLRATNESISYLCAMGVLKQLAEYLYLKKKDPNRPKSDFTRYMHGINRITIFLFILGLIILAIKLLT